MRRFLTLFVLVPIAIVVIVLSVANRGAVSFSLDPIGAGSTGWTVTAPLYVFLFAALALGVLIGGIAAWIRQGRWRQAARTERATAERLRAEVAELRGRVETLQRAATDISPRALAAPGDRDAA
jgi:uncharacterized integral membrane protein